MKPVRFAPVVAEISAGDTDDIPGLKAVISHWTEGERSANAWFEKLSEVWGTAGFVMRRGDSVLGFLVYGPPEYLPHAGRYPVGPLSEDAALLAYVEGDARTRKRLLIRMLKDLRGRGVVRVEAVASDVGSPNHASTAALLESGWKAARRGWYRGRPYTLARADLGSLVEVGEVARGILGRVRLPGLKTPAPAPGAFSAGGTRDQGGRITVLTADAPRGVVARNSKMVRGGSTEESGAFPTGASKDERSTSTSTVFVSSAFSFATSAR